MTDKPTNDNPANAQKRGRVSAESMKRALRREFSQDKCDDRSELP